MDGELTRGTLEMVLLQLPSEKEMYGCEVTAVRPHGRGARGGRRHSLPGALPLEKAGNVKPYWETQERGVPTKYYRIAAAGGRDLDRRRRERGAGPAVVSGVTEHGAHPE